MSNGFALPQSYGAVIFDRPEDASEGWACAVNDKPFRVSSTGDLSSGTVWYTNIPMETFFKKGFRQSPKLRPEGYLRTQHNSLMIELNLRNESPETQVLVLANLFHRVMHFSYLHLGLTSPPIGMLNNGLRQSSLPADPRTPVEVLKAAGEASQSYVECEKRNIEDRASLISLVFHRFMHAKHILSSNYPTGSWSRLDSANLPRNTSQAFEAWQHQVGRPALFQVTINAVATTINHLINYGAGAGMEVAQASEGGRYITYKRRCFMTGEELQFMLNYADITIDAAYLADNYGPAPVVLPNWGNFTENSFAFGLYAENLWTSLTRSLDGKSAKSPLSAWIHSYDRLACLRKAMEIDAEGIAIVHSYGYGRITLRLPESRRGLAAQLALTHKLISPMANKDEVSTYAVSGKDGKAALMQAAMDRRARKFLEQLDEKAIDEAVTAKVKQHSSVNSNRLTL